MASGNVDHFLRVLPSRQVMFLHLCVTFLAVAIFTPACIFCLHISSNGLLFKFNRWKGKPVRYLVEFKKNRFAIGNDHQFNTLSDLIEVWND